MTTQHVRVDRVGSILQLTLNRPEKLNAITPQMRTALGEAVETFRTDDELRVMLIQAVGRYFTSGVEVSPELVPGFGGSTRKARDWYRQRFLPIFTEMELIEKPIVAAHQGPCLGGGLEMSLSCDFRLAAQSAHYRLPEIFLGMLPGSGGTSRLTRLVGPHWARWLVMAGEEIDAARALSIGLVHDVYPDDEFPDRVWSFCRRLAELPPEAVALSKAAIELAADLETAQARRLEQMVNSILFTGDERAQYLQKFLDARAARKTKGT